MKAVLFAFVSLTTFVSSSRISHAFFPKPMSFSVFHYCQPRPVNHKLVIESANAFVCARRLHKLSGTGVILQCTEGADKKDEVSIFVVKQEETCLRVKACLFPPEATRIVEFLNFIEWYETNLSTTVPLLFDGINEEERQLWIEAVLLTSDSP